MPLLDTKTINVATVQAAVASGEIRNIRYWNPNSGTYTTTPPANVPFGSLIGCLAAMKNTSAYTQSMYMVFRLKRPDGSVKSVCDHSNNRRTVSAGGEYDGQGWTDFADVAGTWQMTIELYGEVV